MNSFYGYRTPKSMKLQKHWDFAQRFSSKLMIQYGISLCLLSLLAFFIHLSEGSAVGISLGLILLLTISLIMRVEKELRDTFD